MSRVAFALFLLGCPGKDSSGVDGDGDGFSAEADCDDEDAAVHPDAIEVPYDAVDNDCDPGTADDDLDGDGVGVAEDCDDGDASTWPGAEEVCGDGRVNDCHSSGQEANERCNVDLGLSHAPLKLLGEREGDYAGRVAAGGDVDGDGQPDLLIGAARDEGGGSDAGAVYLVQLPRSGAVSLTEADAKLVGEHDGDFAGRVAGAGDSDGDGFDDVLVGARHEDSAGEDAGAVYLVSGPVEGLVGLELATARWLGEHVEDDAGSAIAGLGDVDGDGLDDALVGAPDEDTAGRGAGAVYLLSGPITGLDSLSSASARLVGEGPQDEAGWVVAAAGDTDGDGLNDGVVGAPYRDVDGGPAGAVYLVEGPMTDLSSLSDAAAIWLAESPLDGAGYAADGAGDADGDGLADLVVGALYSNSGGILSGAAYLVAGTTRGTSALDQAEAKFVGESWDDHAGRAVAGAGDVDADGLSDLLIGAPGEDLRGMDTGAAYLMLAPLEGSVNLGLASAKLKGELGGDHAGGAVAGVGDVDSDGRCDLFIGATGQDGAGVEAGAAYLILASGLELLGH